MASRRRESHRAKVSVTVDLAMLKVVDEYVEQHEGFDRSKIIDDALLLWYTNLQAKVMEEQFAAPASPTEQAEYEAWRRIRRAAAERLFSSKAVAPLSMRSASP